MSEAEFQMIVKALYQSIGKGNEPERAKASRQLVDLGVIYNGSGPMGYTLVNAHPLWTVAR